MKCSRCGGEMEGQIVRFCACDGSPPVLIENVPANVCKRCGGQVFSDEVAAVFERIVDGDDLGPRIAMMKVYDYERARQGRPTHSVQANGNVVSFPGTEYSYDTPNVVTPRFQSSPGTAPVFVRR